MVVALSDARIPGYASTAAAPRAALQQGQPAVLHDIIPVCVCVYVEGMDVQHVCVCNV